MAGSIGRAERKDKDDFAMHAVERQ